MGVKVSYLLSYRGAERTTDCHTSPRVILVTLSPPKRRGIRGVGIVYGRTLTYTRFVSMPGEPGDMRVQGRTRKRFCEKRSVRSEIRTCVLADVKCEGSTYSMH